MNFVKILKHWLKDGDPCEISNEQHEILLYLKTFWNIILQVRLLKESIAYEQIVYQYIKLKSFIVHH